MSLALQDHATAEFVQRRSWQGPSYNVGKGPMTVDHRKDVRRGPLNVVIIGGSIASLMIGFLLKKNGHNVTILEQSTTSVREGTAAGVGLALHVRTFFEDELGIDGNVLGILHKGFEVLDQNLNVKAFIPKPTRVTSWDCAYYQLRAKFDGLKSSYVKDAEMIVTKGTAIYEVGKKVLNVEPEGNRMATVVEDIATGKSQRYYSDIIIAADGANSSIRRQLNPNLAREEPGYVLWRGTVRTGDLPPDTRATFENRALVWAGTYTYAITYTIPGDDGSLEPGFSHINFVWYTWPTHSSADDILTDTTGHRHRSTVPKGKLRPDIWKAQVEIAKNVLPTKLYELVCLIETPFVTKVTSMCAPKAAYLDNKVFLIGDALTQAQPNNGQGANLAAFAAKGLAEAIGKVDDPAPVSSKKGHVSPFVDAEKIAKWQRTVLATNEVVRVDSVAFGSRYLHTRFWTFWRYLRVWLFRWWYKKLLCRME
ncbi:hypothetical protein CKM354_000029400 [Cercospora kikuchii]|uniref:2,6-dihydroxypyridine 3-monooxygenase substrate binding domain-containing protein n=1 Tax=Cercospora kikuchii TaxID=84275 RepID=A0A9P3FAV5_9PEZI|nr:uncharacterized protein CKM354_000029400 [Cercospora kikuchii]GIZ36827.1 hypothetical protein CKM354_000029400 [Cercospora kikuchii]